MTGLHTEQIFTADYFQKAHWPELEQENIVFFLQGELLFDAAKIIAIVAYPADKDLRLNGPAHQFSKALIAWMFRTARKRSYINNLPKWVARFKTQQMNGRIQAGIRRVDYRLKSYLTFMEVENLRSEQEQKTAGIIPGITIRSSEDFSQMRISIRFDANRLPPTWKVPYAEKSRSLTARKFDGVPLRSRAVPSAFRSVISNHRKAFRKGSGDSESDYKNIYNRYVRTLFPVLHFMPTLHEAMLDVRHRNEGRELSEVLLLLLQPEWAEAAPARIINGESLAILRIRSLGIPFCNCRLIHLRSAS